MGQDDEKRASSFWGSASIYQIFPDRFAIGQGVTAEDKYREGRYPYPEQSIARWTDAPYRNPKGGHQHRFWGGDLPGITEKLDEIHALGCDTLYLTPIFQAITNHKYDTVDYFKIDPAFGTIDDFRELCAEVHKRGMRLILDGVFNHASRQCLWLSEGRDEFFYPLGNGEYRCRENIPHLVEINLENPAAQEVLFYGKNSVLKYWLREGADGWRIDCAHDLGPRLLESISHAMRAEFPDALLVGEVWNYPAGWKNTGMDGIMNYTFQSVVYDFLRGILSAGRTGAFLADMAKDTGLAFLSRCWNMCSSHDVERLGTILPKEELVRLAIVLQFAYPGTPFIYYGEERGMMGGPDPENRGAVNWEEPDRYPERRALITRLNRLRKEKRALTAGLFELVTVSDERVLGFKRRTADVAEQLIVLINPTPHPIETRVYLKDGWVMGGTRILDLDTGEAYRSSMERFVATLAPYQYRLLEPQVRYHSERYTPYKRLEGLTDR